jgi:hypothetical protein
MQKDELIFCANDDRPRHPHQEIADLLAVALLRLRVKDSSCDSSATAGAKDEVDLGFSGQVAALSKRLANRRCYTLVWVHFRKVPNIKKDEPR